MVILHHVCLHKAGEYTAERLKELQKNAISFSASRLAASQGGNGEGTAAGLGAAAPAQPMELPTLKGSFKPAGATKDDGRFGLEPIAVVC
jgi:GC-rich sequence DNA-binding factor